MLKMFVLEPLHTKNVFLQVRYLNLAIFLLLIFPLFCFFEFILIFHFNKVVRWFKKATDGFNLVNITGNPVFMVQVSKDS